jgi:Mrp family chromosome partitioning ATPase
MTTSNVPSLGLVEVPALGEILRALGYRVISGNSFPESASAVKIALDTEAAEATLESPAMIIPIIVADVHRPGIKAWAQKHARTAPVLILRGSGDDYIVATDARSLQLPASVKTILTTAGLPVGTDPRVDLVIGADGTVAQAAPAAPIAAPAPLVAPVPLPVEQAYATPAPVLPPAVSLPVQITEPVAAPVPPAAPGAPVRAPWDTRPSEPVAAPELPAVPIQSVVGVEPSAEEPVTEVVEPPAFERAPQLLFPEPEAEIVDEVVPAVFEVPAAAPVLGETVAPPVPVQAAPAPAVPPVVPVVQNVAPFFEGSARPTQAVRPQWRNRTPAFGPPVIVPAVVPAAVPVAVQAPPAPVPVETPVAAPVPAPAPIVAPTPMSIPVPEPVAVPVQWQAPVAVPAPVPVAETAPVLPVAPAPEPIPIAVAVEAPAPVDDAPSWASFVAPEVQPGIDPTHAPSFGRDETADGSPAWAVAPAQPLAAPVYEAPVAVEPVLPVVVAEPEPFAVEPAQPVAFTFEPEPAIVEPVAAPVELPWMAGPVVVHLNDNPAPVLFCWAYKGGVNKTSLSLQLAHRASELGKRVWLIDMNRGQGGIRTVLRIPETAPIRSAFDAARIGDPERAFVRPDEYTQYRPLGLPLLKFGLALAPPRAEADPESTPYTAYQQIINWARNNGDLVIVDTQSVEAVDQSGLISQVMVPTMINGGFGLGITEFAKESVENLKAAYGTYRTAGLDNSRQLMVVTRADNFLPVDARGVDSTFSKYADFAGTTAQSRFIKEQFDKGIVVSDDPGVTPLLDTVLLRVTADERFSSMPMPGAEKPKRKSLFGGGRK